MLTRLDTTWLVFAIAAVAMLSYLFSIALDAVLGEAGFGPVGNGAIITFGFFTAIYAGNYNGIRFDLAGGIMIGLAGAFSLLLFMVLLKATLNRMI